MELQKENKMGVMPVGRLILNMSVPLMICRCWCRRCTTSWTASSSARVSEEALLGGVR